MHPANTLFDYMTLRAEHEGVEHQLSKLWYQQNFDAGIRRFFNVTVDDSGVLLADTEQPEFFQQWNNHLQQAASRN